MRVLLAGAFGQGNPGDEALLNAFRSALADHEIVPTSADTVDTCERHGVNAVPSDDLGAVLRTFRTSGAVVYGGGTVLKRLHRATGRPANDLLRKAAALGGATKLTGRRLALVGIGATHLSSVPARLYARSTVRAADLLIVRDEASADHVAALGSRRPEVGADPAWTLFGRPRRSDNEGPIIVALSYHAGGGGLAHRLAASLRTITERHPVAIQPWQVQPSAEMDDRRLAAELDEQLRGEVTFLPPPRDLGDAVGTFTGSRLVVALRFHAIMAAAIAGSRTVAVGHETKLTELARRLGQPSVADVADLDDGIVDALAGPVTEARAVERERERADQMMQRLRDLLASAA